MGSLLLHTLNLIGSLIAVGLVAAAVITYATMWYLEQVARCLNKDA